MAWQLRLVDKLFRQRQVLPFARAEWTERMNQADGLVVDGLTRDLRPLTEPGWGAVLTDDTGRPRFSGLTFNWQKVGPGLATITLTGDLFRVLARVVYPSPGSVWADQSGSAYDTVTGPAEDRLLHYLDVNAGPSAIVARRVPGLTLPESLGRGAIGTSKHRFSRFPDLLANFEAVAGLRLTVIRQPDGSLPLSVTVPPDLSNSAVGPRLADEGWTHSETLPSATVALIAGGGVGVARTTAELEDAAATEDFGIRIEEFVDQRDTTVDEELLQAGGDALTEAQGVRSISANIVPDSMLPVGLRVGVRIDDQVVVDRIREQIVTIGGDEGPTVSYAQVFGSPDAGLTISQRDLRLIRRRLAKTQRTET